MSITTPGQQEAVDRQRQRAERGIRSSGGGRGMRVPSAPNRRRPALAALAVLLVVGGALVAGLLALRMDERVPVLAVAANVEVGHQFQRADLTETRVASEGIRLIAADQAEKVIGRYATVNISKGQLLDQSMLTQAPPLQDGQVAIGVVLVEGRIPAGGIRSGDRVELIRIGQGTVPPKVIGEATVIELKAAGKASLGQSQTASETATVLIDAELSKDVADASGNNKIALALIKRGTSVGK